MDYPSTAVSEPRSFQILCDHADVGNVVHFDSASVIAGSSCCAHSASSHWRWIWSQIVYRGGLSPNAIMPSVNFRHQLAATIDKSILKWYRRYYNGYTITESVPCVESVLLIVRQDAAGKGKEFTRNDGSLTRFAILYWESGCSTTPRWTQFIICTIYIYIYSFIY